MDQLQYTNMAREESKHIPMKFKVMRIISIAFIDLLICCLEARYARMTEIKNPFRQSWTYIELLCRAHTWINKDNIEFTVPLYIFIIWMLRITAQKKLKYQTFSRIKTSLSSFHPRKKLLMNSVSSISMSSRILVLYLGVAWMAVPLEY